MSSNDTTATSFTNTSNPPHVLSISISNSMSGARAAIKSRNVFAERLKTPHFFDARALAAGFFAAGFFLAAGFLAAGFFFAAGFFAAGFFLAAGFFFAAGFFAAGFFFVAVVFFTAGFFAAGFFPAGFFAAGFFAAGFFAGALATMLMGVCVRFVYERTLRCERARTG